MFEFRPQAVDGASLARRAYWRTLRPVRLAWWHRDVSAADVAIASYPRSGNLWMRFVVLLALTGRAPPLDEVHSLVPIVGAHRGAPAVLAGGGRLLKTHERFRGRYQRAIYIYRDPRDVSLSYFKHLQRRGSMSVAPIAGETAFDRFLTAFLKGWHEPHGTWGSHIESWLDAAAAHPGQIFIVRYEDLRERPEEGVGRLAEWFGLHLDAAQVGQIVEASSIDRVRELTRDWDAMVDRRLGRDPGQFTTVNSGKVGAWRAVLSQEQASRFRIYNEALARAGYEAA